MSIFELGRKGKFALWLLLVSGGLCAGGFLSGDAFRGLWIIVAPLFFASNAVGDHGSKAALAVSEAWQASNEAKADAAVRIRSKPKSSQQ